MKLRRARAKPGAERRRKLAEINLLAEQDTKQTAASARGCALPFIGLVLTAALPLALWLR
jgi:hypothetical protein